MVPHLTTKSSCLKKKIAYSVLGREMCNATWYNVVSTATPFFILRNEIPPLLTSAKKKSLYLTAANNIKNYNTSNYVSKIVFKMPLMHNNLSKTSVGIYWNLFSDAPICVYVT